MSRSFKRTGSAYNMKFTLPVIKDAGYNEFEPIDLAFMKGPMTLRKRQAALAAAKNPLDIQLGEDARSRIVMPRDIKGITDPLEFGLLKRDNSGSRLAEKEKHDLVGKNNKKNASAEENNNSPPHKISDMRALGKGPIDAIRERAYSRELPY